MLLSKVGLITARTQLSHILQCYGACYHVVRPQQQQQQPPSNRPTNREDLRTVPVL